MGSTIILKVRICQKTLKPLFHPGSSAFFTQKTSLCKSLQLAPSARFLCTRDSNPGGRDINRRYTGQGGTKKNTIRQREEESWEDTVKGRGKGNTLRQRPSFPKSVFAAGTAKRTTEMLRRKAVLGSWDEDLPMTEPKERPQRGTGSRTSQN